MLDDLAQKGEWETRNEILKSIRETDSDIAVHQYSLIKQLVSLSVMLVGRIAYTVTDRYLNKIYA